MIHARRTVLALTACVAVVAAVAAPALAVAPYGAGQLLSRFTDARITESSGVAVSTPDDRVLFTHNDSGEDTLRFFAVDRTDGTTLATFTIPGPDPSDVEDMAKGPDERGRSSLWFGDIGNNANDPRRGGTSGVITVHRVLEPAVDRAVPVATTEAPTSFAFRYGDMLGHDAETLLVHPRTGQLFIVSKTPIGNASLYAAPLPLSATGVNVLDRVADLVFPQTGRVDSVFGPAGPLATTGGAFSPAGDLLVIRTYTDAYEYRLPGSSEAEIAAAVQGVASVRGTPISLPMVPQGEAIAYTNDGRSLVVTSERSAAEAGPIHLLVGAGPAAVVPEVPVVLALPVLGALLLAATLIRRRAAAG